MSLPAQPAPATAATLWKQRYEALRQVALVGSQMLEADPLGLVLLLRQGVAGWMNSWPACPQNPSPQPAPVRPAPVLSVPAWQQQLTQLLAQMSLAHLPNTATL